MTPTTPRNRINLAPCKFNFREKVMDQQAGSLPIFPTNPTSQNIAQNNKCKFGPKLRQVLGEGTELSGEDAQKDFNSRIRKGWQESHETWRQKSLTLLSYEEVLQLTLIDNFSNNLAID